MSLRRLRALVAALPRQSATAVATLGRAEADWDQQAELLATIIDVQQWILHVLVRANFEGKPKQPLPFPRPGMETPKQPKVSTAHLETVMQVASHSKGRSS